ncbi:hypothetical protein MML48_9g00002217 [Holotrichia oblita]|uniref:Uncharacterized protein n=1 Tax=Holotrichia oblita TaxID=644536 RepID=A0ACB9SJD3_HOLOL|nr:hypothetical protein MML48_9g00002217 [Holotrichia oblita]
MAVIYLRIQGDGYKYGKYFVTNDLVIKYGNLAELQRCDVEAHQIDRCSSTRIKFNINGIFLHFLLNELIYCGHYRSSFVNFYVPNELKVNTILFDLQNTTDQIIDYKWNEILNYLVREKCELEHALSWLSTLGGAFSALGDYFASSALVGKISYHQLVLAIRMGDPTIASRCKLYFSLSLIQRHKFKLARKIIEAEFQECKNAVILDTRLVKMCLGIWSKLQYEHQKYRQEKKSKRLQK